MRKPWTDESMIWVLFTGWSFVLSTNFMDVLEIQFDGNHLHSMIVFPLNPSFNQNVCIWD